MFFIFAPKNIVYCKPLSCFGESGNVLADSNETMTRRIEDLHKYAEINSCTYLSLALDESCDISDISELIIAVRMVDDYFNVSEEILALIPPLRNTKVIDRFDAINGRLELKNESTILTAICICHMCARNSWKKDGLLDS